MINGLNGSQAAVLINFGTNQQVIRNFKDK